MDQKYTDYPISQLHVVLSSGRIQRRFDQFCKWAKVGDYVIVGTGSTTQFNMKIIRRIVGEYEFDASHPLYRYYRKIEIMKTLDKPVSIEKWEQIQRIELVDDNDFIGTLVKIIPYIQGKNDAALYPTTHYRNRRGLAGPTLAANNRAGTAYPTPDGTCIRDYIHVMD